MSSDRDALLERFRAGLLARIERIDALVDGLPAGRSDGTERQTALGELHTLKGEGRMLGLVGLADLAHALESWLGQGGAADNALDALDAMRRSLGAHVPQEIGEAVLEAALLELGSRAERAAEGGPTAQARTVPSQTDAEAQPDSARRNATSTPSDATSTPSDANSTPSDANSTPSDANSTSNPAERALADGDVTARTRRYV